MLHKDDIHIFTKANAQKQTLEDRPGVRKESTQERVLMDQKGSSINRNTQVPTLQCTPYLGYEATHEARRRREGDLFVGICEPSTSSTRARLLNTPTP